MKIHFVDGANVKKGQLLFTVDPRPFEANLKQAEANLARDAALKKQAEANLAREVAREKWGHAQVERYRTLVEQGVVAKEQYEQLRAEYDSLRANSEAARAIVRSADETIKVDHAAIETAKVQLSYCYIHSPIDGRAGQRLVDVGIPVMGHLGVTPQSVNQQGGYRQRGTDPHEAEQIFNDALARYISFVLPALGCALMMGAMMWTMMGGMGGRGGGPSDRS